ncbi:class II SORL domain-containing protein [Thermanaerovibrio acidaminovorans]|uniref:Superoxide reductase n=1 Tax=Thermanaerovibrio acidaminovorans (strain ATCC 49978 / DSM 6589 / Su883) TaxID=525903 RepID=D1B7J5_THEAS|nr:class II SORL domain-containing protein [Thermanaerovibrio acidaminovorans]ACZ18248.1 Superoxide reductase [Thermanaerovibrio acidaminovorans DSM 6589]
MKMADLIQSGDWKGEKHVPVIEVKGPVKAGEPFEVQVSVGKEIPHPNTTEHHIRWIQLIFKPEGGKFPYEVGRVTFDVHGESTDGANQGPAHTEPFGVFRLKVAKGGTLTALSYCNIHGLWESSVDLAAE